MIELKKIRKLDMVKSVSLLLNVVLSVIMFLLWATNLSISHFGFDFYPYTSEDVTDNEVLHVLRTVNKHVYSIDGVVFASVSPTNGGIEMIVASGRLDHQNIDRKVLQEVDTLLERQFAPGSAVPE